MTKPSDGRWFMRIGMAGVIIILGLIAVVVYRSFTFESVDVEPWMEGQFMTLGEIHHHFEYFKPADRRHWHDKDKDFSRLATTYYHRCGPVGRVLERYNWVHGPMNTFGSDVRMPAALVASAAQPLGLAPLSAVEQVWSEPPIGVVFLQAATVANYGRPFQRVDFYERNPAVIELFSPESDKRKFHTIQSAVDRGVNVHIIPGDELDALASGPKGFYQVLIVEMARTGRFPLNYIRRHATPRALAIFSEAITEDGIICFHTSSREDSISVDVADAASAAGFHVLSGLDNSREKDRFVSHWLVAVRRAQDAKFLHQPGAIPGFVDRSPFRFFVVESRR